MLQEWLHWTSRLEIPSTDQPFFCHEGWIIREISSQRVTSKTTPNQTAPYIWEGGVTVSSNASSHSQHNVSPG